jgi:hypothetical protein
MAVTYGTGPFAPGVEGANTALDVTAATVIKSTPGVLYSISVVAAGTAVGAVYDSTSTSGNTSANQITTIGTAVTTQPLVVNWRCSDGIVVTPPSGGTVSVSFV